MSITRKCTIDGCERVIHANGMCNYHCGIKWRIDNPLYSVWSSMKARCYDKNNKRYADWGGRGIKVCDRWLNSYKNFYEDMGDKPTPDHSLDRIDNNKDYSPSNCKWSDKSEQSLNKRPMYKNNKSGHRRVYYYKQHKKWQCSYQDSNGKNKSIGFFNTKDEAINALHLFLGYCKQCDK